MYGYMIYYKKVLDIFAGEEQSMLTKQAKDPEASKVTLSQTYSKIQKVVLRCISILLSKDYLNDQFDVMLNYYLYMCKMNINIFKKSHKAGKPFLAELDIALTASINNNLAKIRNNPNVNFQKFEKFKK